MPDYGAVDRPLRSSMWFGGTSDTASDRGEGFIRRIIGGYVRGNEIRTWPGFRTAIDPTVDSDDPFSGVMRPGWRQEVIDAERPVARRQSRSFVERQTVTDRMKVWADPVNLHSIAVVRRSLVIMGESRFRVEPLLANDADTDPIVVTGWTRDGSNRAVLHLSGNPSGAANGHHNRVQAGDPLWVDGLVDANTADASALNGKTHEVLSVGVSTVTLKTTLSAASVSSSLHGMVGRTRGNKSGTLTPGKTPFESNAADRILDPDAFTVWWVDNVIDPEGDVIEDVYASYVFNRRRDFSDQTPAISAIPGGAGVQSLIVEGHVPFNFTTVGGASPQKNWGIPRRPTKPLPYRIGHAVAGDRIIVCSREYGCLFQVPAIIPTIGRTTDPDTLLDGAFSPKNQEHDAPRCLGVPKAVIVDYPTQGVSAANIILPLFGATPSPFSVHAGTGGFLEGVYRIAVAYRDDATGEIGQLSEPWEFTLPAPAVAGDTWNISVDIMHPGYVMAETGALSCMIFMSKAGDQALGHILTIQCGDDYAFAPTAATSQSSSYGLTVYSSDASSLNPAVPGPDYYRFPIPLAFSQGSSHYDELAYDYDIAIPTQNQMPRGAKCVSVTRGVMIAGGSAGSFGRDRELIPGKLGINYTAPSTAVAVPAIHENARHYHFRTHSLDYSGNLETIPWPSGNGRIPPAYAGSPILSKTLFPFPAMTQTIDRIVNPGFKSNAHDVSYQWVLMDEQPQPAKDSAIDFDGHTCYIRQFRGFLQASELGQPNITVATNNIPVDAKKDDDIEAQHEFRGTLVICTNRQTFGLLWSVGPFGNVPFTLSNEFGCIATNSMVEGDTMLAWISERGPAAYMGNGIEHIGKPLQRDFQSGRFLRDRRGRMLHSWGCHDEERGLLLFGVFENRNRGLPTEVQTYHNGSMHLWDDASDEARSRFPCDVVLIYSEQNNAWSEWYPPDGMEMLCMAMVPCLDGKKRLAGLAQDKRVYLFDDHFGDTNREPLILTALVSSSGTSCTIEETVGQAKSDRNGSGSFVRTGCEAIVYNEANGSIRSRATVSAADASTLTFSSAIEVVKGDRILVMPRSMTIELVAQNAKGSVPTSIQSVIVRVQPRSRILEGIEESTPQPIWTKAVVAVSRSPSSTISEPITSHTFHANQEGDFIGTSDPTGQTRSLTLDAGQSEGFEHRLTVEIFGGAQACVQDILIGVA